MKQPGTTEITKFLLFLGLFALLGALWWYTMEKRMSAVPIVATAAKENTFLGASRFLKKHDYRIKPVPTLEAALDHPLPKGTLFLRSMSGTIEPDQVRSLLSWIEQGNTIVYQPRWTGKSLALDMSKRCNKTPLLLSDDISDSADEKADEEADEKADEAKTSNDSPPQGEQVEGGGNSDASGSDAKSETKPEASSQASSESKDESKKSAKKSAKKDDDEEEDEVRVPDFSIDPRPRTRLSSGNVDAFSKLLGIELRKIAFHETKSEKDKTRNPAKAMDKLMGKKAATCPADISWPNLGYPLQLDPDNLRLFTKNTDNLKLADQTGQALRIYQQGQGHIVVLAEDYFQNVELPNFDHAQLLLQITSLQPERTVLVIQHLKHETWYQKLWNHFHFALIAFALGLLLWLWISLRRFGSVLPIPEPNRRALMEHIDASSRWLWQVPGGREILLDAMRSLTVKVLQRRAPAIMRLSQTEQIAQLSELCSINRPDLVLALSSGAASTPLLFIRQIKTLQRLRKHYER